MTEVNWDVYAQLFYNGAYNVLQDLVPGERGATLTRGVADDLDLKPGVCQFRLYDDDDVYRPSNAASALYGQIGPWTPGAYATGGSVRFTGEATSIAPDQTDRLETAGGDLVKGVRWVDVTLGGTLARIGRWRDNLDDPLRVQIDRYAATLKGYWPMTDGKTAKTLANRAPSVNARPATFTDCTLAGADGPAGSSPVIAIGSTGSVYFSFLPMDSSAGYQIAFAAELPNASASNLPILTWTTTAGEVLTWSAGNASYTIDVKAADGTSLLNSTTLSGTDANAQAGRWIYYRFKVHKSGTTVTVEQSWYNSDAATFWGVTSTYTGSMGAPRTGNIPSNATTNGGHFGHLFAVTGNTDDLESTDFTDAFNAYAGELAADRFERLMNSRGLPWVLRGDHTTTRAMGPQPIDTFQAQLKEIRSTEGGLIFDRGDNLGVVLVTRAQLYANALDPVLALTWPDDIAAGGLKETTASADVFNYVTARNANGSSWTAELTSGTRGTADPPTGAGRLDKVVDVNVDDDSVLPDIATWWMRFWTQEQPRFDQVVIDADAHPELLAACNSAEPGTFITLTGRTPDPLTLMIISCGQASTRKRNVFTFGVVAGGVFLVGTYDGTDRYDALGSTLNAGLTATATSAVARATSWGSTWGPHTPYPVMIAGERCTVTNATTPVLAGGVYTQTLTLTRSVNGVVKTQASGAAIHIADVRTYG